MTVEPVMVFKRFDVKSSFAHFLISLFYLSGFDVKLSFVEDSLARYRLYLSHTYTG